MSRIQWRRSVLARSSVSPKGVNQDASVAIHHDVPGYSLLAVADGIGSHPGAETGARLAVEAAAEDFRKADPRRLDPRTLFSGAADALGALATKENVQPAERDKRYGTTLLCVVETPAEFRIAYVGNGGIFHVRPWLLGSGLQNAAGWAATNLLSPHSVSRDGKDVLVRFLSGRGCCAAANPAALTLSRDLRRGEIILVCTDGLWSADQLTVGVDSEGKTWQLHEEPLARILLTLGKVASGDWVDRRAVETALAACLEELNRESFLDDDCTVALIDTRGSIGAPARATGQANA